MLDGLIEIDFGDLVFSGSSAEFDIVRSGGLNGIDGGFDNVSFINLLSGYAATAGIEQINGQEVFRVRLARTDVPEPSSVVMALLGLALLRRLSQPRAERPVRA